MDSSATGRWTQACILHGWTMRWTRPVNSTTLSKTVLKEASERRNGSLGSLPSLGSVERLEQPVAHPLVLDLIGLELALADPDLADVLGVDGWARLV